MSTIRRSFGGGHFLFRLDTVMTDAGYLRSVSGGQVKAEVLTESAGPEKPAQKHLGSVEIEPITVELGMALSKPFLDWIRSSWQPDGEGARMNGAIIHADSTYKSRFEQVFQDALIAATTFPELDGSSRDPAYLTVTIHPESLKIEDGDNSDLVGKLAPKQKQWLQSNFRVEIDGIDTRHVNKVASFSVKQKIKPLHIGSQRFPQLEPTAIEFPNLTLTLALEHARDFIKWHRDWVIKGDSAPKQERNGVIEFLAPDLSQVLLTVKLMNVGIFGLQIDKSEAGTTHIERCKVELYVDRMELEYGSGLE